MPPAWTLKLLGIVVVVQALSMSAFAYTKEVRLPLAGCRGYFAASGSATYKEVFADSTQKASRELVVEIQNMPLPPGTVLVISVDEQTIGKVTLDSRRNATLRLTNTNSQKKIAPLEWGTRVNVTKVDGTIVIW